MAPRLITVVLALCCCSHGAILSEPTSQIAFEGEVSVFSCHSNETLFWQINGQIYDFSLASDLKSRGFVFSDTYDEGSVVRSISVVGNKETNNTLITCISVDQDNRVIISGNATLTVLGSPSNVTLTLTDSNSFKLTWQSPSTPVGYEPHNYTVTVQYKDSATLTNTESFTVQSTNETDYVFDYAVSTELSSCSQFVFSVVSSGVMGDSQPVRMTWEMPLDASSPIEDLQCRLQLNRDDSITALVQFTFPDLCHFQSANYSFSLSSAVTNSAPVAKSDTLTFVGGADRDVEGQLGDLKLDLSVYYRVRVKSQLEGGEMINAPSTLCNSSDISRTTPSIGSLSVPTGGDQSALLVGIVIGSVFLFLTLTVYVVSLVVLCTCMKK
ncbi:uncharacterized protein LOC135334403 isoform X3 [Halichondria panicea]|uniref:uncharacterized protein LOC135334403 isoform X3 n=1 Tax=Halichondria panicea TaxID=6063 RepID=UPI00312B5976